MGNRHGIFWIGVAVLMGGAALLEAAPSDDLLWIADFNDGKLITQLSGGIGAWQFDPNDRSSWCDASVSPQEVHFGEPGYSMKIEYNISSGKENYVSGQDSVSSQEVGFHGQAFNGVYMILNKLDVSAHKYLVFSARGDTDSGFSRKFKLELKDQERSQSISFDRLTAKWQKFYVALDPFSTALNLKELKEIIFVFDRAMTRSSGAMYIDDVYFAKSKAQEQELVSLGSEAEAAVTAPRAKSVIVDGNLSDWSGIPGVSLGPKNLEFGLVRNRRDLSAQFKFQWDERYLFFAAEVRDNDVICTYSGRDIHRDDLIELFIDPQNDGLVWSSTADYQIGFAPTGPGQRPQVWAWFQGREPFLQDIIYNAKVTKSGYVVEAAISWEFLNLKPEDNRTFGISPAVHDVDRKKQKAETKLNWQFIQNPVDPQRHTLGILKLGEK